MFNKSAWGWAVTAAVLLGGCAHQGVTVPEPKEEAFRIGREDVVDIAVWRDPDLSRVIPVRPDGFISMPMIGEVKAAGLTPVDLAEQIKGKLQAFVQDPKVTVIVREVNSTRVYLTGEVAHPGSYPLRGTVSLIQAVALAGGFSDFANRDRIVVIRPGKDGGKYPVRYSDLMDDEHHSEVLLQSGDTVVVP